MAIIFTGTSTFKGKGNKSKVKIKTVDGVHYAKCECGNKWESTGIPKTICNKCKKDT